LQRHSLRITRERRLLSKTRIPENENRLHIVPESVHLCLFPHFENFQLVIDMILELCRSGQGNKPDLPDARKSHHRSESKLNR